MGVSNEYVLRSALPTPKVDQFWLSKDVRDLVRRVDKLARYGLDLNQRQPQPEKLRPRVQSRFGGGVLQLTYRH